MQRFVASGLALLASLALVADAQADVLMLGPAKDNTLFEPDLILAPPPPTDRSNGAGAYFFTGRVGGFGGADGLRRGLLAFDIDGSIPAGSTINSVTLTVQCSLRPFIDAGNPRTNTLHKLTTDWGEGADDAGMPGGNDTAATAGAATWDENFEGASSWTTAGGDFVAAVSSSVAVVDSGASYTFPSTAALVADVQAMLDSPATDFGWIMLGDEAIVAPFGIARRFDSREGAIPPVLTVDFTPPPSVTATCAGDGSYPTSPPGGCPCGNNSAPASGEGCLNSSLTTGGGLSAFGSPDVSLTSDALRLDATHPALNSGLLLVHTSIFSPGIASTGFDGIACVGGGPRALPGSDNGLAQPFGDIDLVAGDGIRNLGGTTPGTGIYGLINTTFPGYFVAGVTYHGQFWYRDVLCGPPPAPCNTVCTTPPPAAANFTNAVSWTVTP